MKEIKNAIQWKSMLNLQNAAIKPTPNFKDSRVQEMLNGLDDDDFLGCLKGFKQNATNWTKSSPIVFKNCDSHARMIMRLSAGTKFGGPG